MQFLCQPDFRCIIRQARSSTCPSTGTRGSQSGVGSFLNQSPLELSKCREDVKDEFSGGSRRVDGSIADLTNADVPLSELIDEGDQMPNRSSQTIEPPSEQDIAIAKLLEAGVESWSLMLCA